MIPVVVALVEAALEAPVVHEVLENGAKELKDATHEVRECVKAENERWGAERKALEDTLKVEVKEGEKVKIKTKTPPEVRIRPARGW